MKARDMLAEDHRLIAGVLGALERYLDRLESSDGTDLTDLERFVTFLQEFVEFRHQDKEEAILIPAMVRAGFGWDDRPISEIRRDHEQERYLVRELRYAALAQVALSPSRRRHVAAIGRELVSFLRAHIEKEELLLLPAMMRLPQTVAEHIHADFERFDEQHPAASRFVDLRALGDELVARYAE